MTGSASRDRGQAFPLYIAVVAGLLFAALAFFVVGMAGDTRSDAQGAADAAALAAAREARDTVFVGGDLVAFTPADWEKILQGDRFELRGACAKAQNFAASNDATAECEPALPKFTVAVTTNGTVGKSVVPGSENVHGKATATAVIESRCTLKSVPTPTDTPTATPSATPSPGGDDTDKPAVVAFTCKGGASLDVDPLKPGSLTQLARRLFSIRLTD
ncbi:pilus assembly protein TadG-related protein [Streptomyces sp. NBC_01551]|uniref:pilus assembly protein TadG-related protein n=1 Tax=Streptomyces sp. NBC_01551 TaxID=2975876 RepID=UPI0022577679|nr:pilus assembly protein TadG-related protein [Streptomyces sp. NBC_01551]MCX4527789.1 pilus assembly protein TadG-related protein [Streptomyces sp. NBC_01551]